MAKKKHSTAHLTKYQYKSASAPAKKKRRHHPAVQTRTVYRSAPKKKHHRKHKGSGGGIKLTHLVLASAALGYVTSANHGIAAVKDNAAKLPGAATFGVPATLGLAALAIDKYVKPNKWLRLLGYAGLVTAAMKVGDAGSDFKFVGEGDGGYDLDGDAD